MSAQIGEVLITKDKHAKADEFWCQINSGDLSVGDLIVAYDPNGKRRILGVVVSRENYSESGTTDQYLESRMLPSGFVVRPEVIRIAKIKPLIQDPALNLPPEDRWPVRLLTAQDADLLSKGIPEGQRILAGFIPNLWIPVYAHAEYLLGREGAHINISGKTGLATKTNYAVFQAYSMLAWALKNEVPLAVVLLNVKRGDLMRLHRIPTKNDLPNVLERWAKKVGLEHRIEEIKKMWDLAEREGLNPWGIPIRYFTYQEDPFFEQLRGDLQKMSGDKPQINVIPYRYALKDLRFSDLLAALYAPHEEPPLPQYNMLSIYWREVVEGQRNVSFDDMLRHFRCYSIVDPRTEPARMPEAARQMFDILRRENALLADWHREVAGAIFRRLEGFVRRNQKIIDRQSRSSSNPIRFDALNPYNIHVIQLYGLDDSGKRLLVNALLREIQEGLMSENKKVERVTLFIDELNQYAPKKESLIKEQIVDIAARGRDLCLSLIGAQQFASNVDHEVYNNCSTKVIGRTDEAELEADVYKYLGDFKSIVPDLPKGEMVFKHDIYKTPLRITFPVQLYELER
jgi:hypothetical protein